MKAAKNLDSAGTKQSSSSFIAFSVSRIFSSLVSVGISMGRHSDEISVSANVLRHLECDHLMVTSKVSTGLEEEADVVSDDQLLSALVGSITEVDLQQSGLSSLYDLKASRRSCKSSAEKKSRQNGKANKSEIVSR
jgi:hypothetical protein